MNLVIDYLEIENFKSYYGKNKLGPFHQSFNAVIGPNGSGKSNVIDSLLFVFGFRAQKIRTKKISVLIHNSDQHPDVTSCSVKIFFKKIKQNTNELVPDSEFTVQRTAYKDNSSEYFIDDRRVQYKEVGTLLRDCGVDLDHNRFLILQGEVESISLLKPKAANEHEEGLLEYLEDIIGTIRYKPQLESVSVEIDKVNEIRTEKSNRVQNLQKDKVGLEAPKNEAIKYLKKENELIETRNFYYQAKMYFLEKDLENFQEQCDRIQNEYNELVSKLEETSKENDQIVEESTIKKKEHDKKSKLNEKLKKEFEDFEKEDVAIRESIKHAKEQIKKLQKTIDTETDKIKTYTEMPEKNEHLVKDWQEEVKELEAELEKANALLKSKMDQVNKETNKLQDKKKPVETQLNQLQTVVNEEKTKLDMAKSEVEVFMNNQNYEQNKLEQARTKIEKISESVKEKQSSVLELQESVPIAENDLKKAESEHKELVGKEKTLLELVSKSRQKYSEAQSSFSSNKNRGRVLSFLMKLKSEGKINGIFGRLGDLGAIDEKYDVAVSTACGSLDCIVVDTIDTAQACVESLKQSQVGAATFIALDKQEKWREHLNKKQNTPEDVPRLVDLIKVNDQKIMTAFYYSLRNTLVATNLEQATRIAYGQSQRHRVVTLKGEIIEISGTMSGGGQPMRGRMGSKIANDNEYTIESIKKMQDALTLDEQELRDVVRRKHQLESAIDELNKKLGNSKESLNRFKYEITSLNEQLNALKKNEENILKRINELVVDKEAQLKLEQIVEKHQLEYEKAEQQASEVRNENDEIAKQIVNISKGILDEPKDNVKKLQEKLVKINGLITNANVESKSSKRNLVNSEKKLSNATEDLEQNQASLEQNQKRLEEIDEESKKVVEKHEVVKEECSELAKQIAEITKTFKQSEAKIQKYETEKIDLKHKLDKQKENVTANKRDHSHYANLLESLKLHDIEYLESSCITGTITSSTDENSSDPNSKQAGPVLQKYDDEYLPDADLKGLKEAIQKLEEELKNENPNLNAIQNYRELQNKFMDRVNELEEITQQRDQLCSEFDELRKKRLDEFMGGFTTIRMKLKEIYRTVTIEGDAELELVDSLDPFTEGIVLSVRPPKKSWKNVSNLSGGEKTLSSLSLVFALHEFRSTPIYVMDEIDAALDFKNVSIIAHYIKERTKNAQFIIISLRNNMFELCDRLFGIYKVKNCTSATYIAPALLEFDEKKKSSNNRLVNSNSNNNLANHNNNINNNEHQSTLAHSQMGNIGSNQNEMIEA